MSLSIVAVSLSWPSFALSSPSPSLAGTVALALAAPPVLCMLLPTGLLSVLTSSFDCRTCEACENMGSDLLETSLKLWFTFVVIGYGGGLRCSCGLAC